MPRFTIIVEAPSTATDAAGIRRLREYLKRLGRSCGLRCVDVRQLPAESPKNTAAGNTTNNIRAGSSSPSVNHC